MRITGHGMPRLTQYVAHYDALMPILRQYDDFRAAAFEFDTPLRYYFR